MRSLARAESATFDPKEQERRISSFNHGSLAQSTDWTLVASSLFLVLPSEARLAQVLTLIASEVAGPLCECCHAVFSTYYKARRAGRYDPDMMTTVNTISPWLSIIGHFLPRMDVPWIGFKASRMAC